MKDKYPFAFGYLESAVHRALRELEHGHADPVDTIKCTDALLRDAFYELQFNHGIELHWPDDVKLCSHPSCKNPATVGDTCGLHPHITFK